MSRATNPTGTSGGRGNSHAKHKVVYIYIALCAVLRCSWALRSMTVSCLPQVKVNFKVLAESTGVVVTNCLSISEGLQQRAGFQDLHTWGGRERVPDYEESPNYFGSFKTDLLCNQV